MKQRPWGGHGTKFISIVVYSGALHTYTLLTRAVRFPDWEAPLFPGWCALVPRMS